MATYYESLKNLRRLPKLAALSMKAIVLAIEKVQSDQTRTPAWKAAESARLRNLTADHFPQLRLEAQAARDNVLQDTARARRGDASALPADVRLAREIAMGHAWARAERLLDAGMPLATLIARAAGDNDLLTLDALRAELPTRLLASVGGAFGQEPEQRTQREIQRVLNEVDQASYPMLSKAQQQALDAVKELESGWPSIETTLGLLEMALEPGGKLPNVLASWERGSTFRLDDVKPEDAE